MRCTNTMAIITEEPVRVYDKDECFYISLRRSVFSQLLSYEITFWDHSQVNILCLFTVSCSRSDVRLSLGQFVTTSECLDDRASSAWHRHHHFTTRHPGGRCLPVSAAGVLPQQVRGCDAFQARISIRSTHSSQPTRHTADPHMAQGPYSLPELQSAHINHINFLIIPQGRVFRTSWNTHEVLVGLYSVSMSVLWEKSSWERVSEWERGRPTETGHYVCIAAKPIFVELALGCF